MRVSLRFTPRAYLLFAAWQVFFFASSCGASRSHAPPLKLVGVWHEVQSGDTIASVAKKYGADEGEVAELNDLSDDEALRSREEIFVPVENGHLPGVASRASRRDGGPAPDEATSPAGEARENKSASNAAASALPAGKKLEFEWPVDGQVTSRFGGASGDTHEGIDIAAVQGTPVHAAANGKVLFSGDTIKGYGNLLIVRHDGGIITVYAHNQENLVKEGDAVEKGSVVAKVGNTGVASAFHLHFEVRIDEKPVDPLLYLPRRTSGKK